MAVLRKSLGEVLRAHRIGRAMTLRDVSARARVSLGYISEVERGQKEPSSELLSSLTDALGVPLSQVMRDVSDLLEIEEAATVPVLPLGDASGEAQAYAA